MRFMVCWEFLWPFSIVERTSLHTNKVVCYVVNYYLPVKTFDLEDKSLLVLCEPATLLTIIFKDFLEHENEVTLPIKI